MEGRLTGSKVDRRAMDNAGQVREPAAPGWLRCSCCTGSSLSKVDPQRELSLLI